MKNNNNLKKLMALANANRWAALAIVLIGLASVKLFSLYYSVEADDGHWQQFKTEHNCKLLIGDKGVHRQSWQCDDGKTYYPWRQQR